MSFPKNIDEQNVFYAQFCFDLYTIQEIHEPSESFESFALHHLKMKPE